MASSFTWLDHRPDDAQRVREALSALEQPGTVDPLGFGVVRDAFSELLFPGISTVMTRARYFLFVPWIYEQIDRENRPRPSIVARARDLEVQLIHSLLDGSEDDHRGIIGQNSQETTQQLPSIIYWGGLGRLGIRRFSGTRTDYLATSRVRHSTEDREGKPWHPSLPAPPEAFLDSTTLAMTSSEAEFLRDRILNSAMHTFFSVLARDAESPVRSEFLWDHPLVEAAAPRVREHIHHARLFSVATWGAGLIYNLELERLRSQDMGADEGGGPSLSNAFESWILWVQDLGGELAKWDREAMWSMTRSANASVEGSRGFVDHWLDLVIETKGVGIDTSETRRLLRDREVAIKGTRAKLANRRVREQSQGTTGDALMMFRWPTASRIITDIVEAGL